MWIRTLSTEIFIFFYVLALTRDLLEARLERLLGLCRTLVGCESLVELPVDGVTVGLLTVHEAWWANVQFTFCLSLLEFNETCLKVIGGEISVVDEELAAAVGHVGNVNAVDGS